MADAVDLFAGPGGWDEGALPFGLTDVVGIEWDGDACATATAAGHLRVRADVAAYPTAPFVGVEGVIASPPCQAFSLAGKQAGSRARELLVAHVAACADGWRPPPDTICGDDVRADLTLQPLRWVHDLRPRWVACEQVPPALPLWEAMAEVLRGWGYSAWAGRLSAEEYGVPQTRRRAFLIASLDRPAVPPQPTHTAYDHRAPDKGRAGTPSLFGQLAPWVSMADALGWTGDWLYRNGNQKNAAERAPEEPAPTVLFGNNLNEVRWVVRTGANSMKHNRDSDDIVPYERDCDDPAPTVDGKAGGAWKLMPSGATGEGRPRDTDQPAATLTGKGTAYWTTDRPATTVIGADTIAAPGHRCMSDDCCGRGSRRHMDERSIRVSIEQAAVLQSFRPDYPWQGSKTSKFRQVGNAVPPRLATHVLAAATGRTIP